MMSSAFQPQIKQLLQGLLYVIRTNWEDAPNLEE